MTARPRTAPLLSALLLGASCLAALVPGAARRQAPARWAVIVGIGDYPAVDGASGVRLPGAAQDARAVRDVLVDRWALRDENLRVLLDEAATRAAVEEALTMWLPQRVRPGDLVLVYYAGMGGQLADAGGDEADGLDETLVPHDAVADATREIVDDELALWLRSLPTDRVVYVHDAGGADVGLRQEVPTSRSRFFRRGPGRRGAPPRLEPPGQPAEESGMDVGQAGLLEFAASAADREAVEVDLPGIALGEPSAGGAFTTRLVRELRRAGPDATWGDLFDRTAAALARGGLLQGPRCLGADDLAAEAAFGPDTRDATGGLAVPVTVVRGDEAELGGGAALGVTPGSVLASAAGARLRVTEVTRDRARATLVSGAVSETERVVLAARPLERPGLRVVTDAADPDLAGTEGSSPLGEAPAPGADRVPAHIVVRTVPTGEIWVLGADGYPHAVVDAPASPAPDPDDRLARILAGEAAWLRLAALEHPGGSFRVEVTGPDGDARFGPGEPLSVQVRSELPGFLTLVEVRHDGTVALLEADGSGGGSRIGAGETRTFVSTGGQGPGPVPGGRGLVRAFVTPEPLALDGTLRGPALVDGVADALADAVGRDGEALLLAPWGTGALVYWIAQ